MKSGRDPGSATCKALFERAVQEFGRVDIVVANAGHPDRRADCRSRRREMARGDERESVRQFPDDETCLPRDEAAAQRRHHPDQFQVRQERQRRQLRLRRHANLAASASSRASRWKWRRTASAATPSAPATCWIRRCGPTRTTACSSSTFEPAKCPAPRTIDDVRQAYVNQVPMKRGCTYDDICNAVVFLACDASQLHHRHFPERDRRSGNELKKPPPGGGVLYQFPETFGTFSSTLVGTRGPRVRFGRLSDASLPNQYTSTSTAACCADFTTSSNFRSFVIGALSLAETSGTDSRKLNRKLLLTA